MVAFRREAFVAQGGPYGGNGGNGGAIYFEADESIHSSWVSPKKVHHREEPDHAEPRGTHARWHRRG